MKPAPHTRNAERLAALRAYAILDTPPEPDFDEIVELAAEICDAPISAINLIDADRQWFKAEVGLGVRQMPLDDSICAHAILRDDYIEIPDTLADPRLLDNPLCRTEPGLRFYAGALLKTASGLPLGTLCILDTRPRRLTPLQERSLRVLARQVVKMFDLRRALENAESLRKEADHRVKNSLASVSAVLRMQARQAPPETHAALEEAQARIATVAALHQTLGESVGNGPVDLPSFLGRVAELTAASRPETVALRMEVQPVSVPSGLAGSLGIIVNETMTNALKHGFADGRRGTITIRLADGGDTATLTVQDDGKGPAAAVDPAAPAAAGSAAAAPAQGGGLGLIIVAAAVTKIGGQMDSGPAPGGGMRTTVRFPLPPQPAAEP